MKKQGLEDIIDFIIEERKEQGTILDIKDKKEISIDWLNNTKAVEIHLHEMSANAQSQKQLHSHDYFELIYMYRGSGMQYFEQNTIPIHEGDLYLLNTDVKHGVCVKDSSCVMINVLIRSSFLKQEIMNLLAENEELSKFFRTSLFEKGNEQFIYFEGEDKNQKEDIVGFLLKEWMEEKPCYQLAMKSYLLLLFTELIRTHTSHKFMRTEAKREFSEIVTYVSDHVLDVTLQEVAEVFHYRANYLSKLFKQNTNKSFTQFVSELRLEKVCHYLENTTLSMDEIVELMGYYDRSYFYKTFKKQFGMTPTEFRRGK